MSFVTLALTIYTRLAGVAHVETVARMRELTTYDAAAAVVTGDLHGPIGLQ